MRLGFWIWGFGFKAPSEASAGEASVGVLAVRPPVAVVVTLGTLVDILAVDAIANPPAPRTELTDSREAFRSDQALLLVVGGLQVMDFGFWV